MHDFKRAVNRPQMRINGMCRKKGNENETKIL